MAGSMIEVAQATVTIIPNMQGAQTTISKELGAAAETSGVSAGKKAGGGLAKGLKVAGGAIAAAGTAAVALSAGLYKMGTDSAAAADEIDKMSQKIGISRKTYQELDYVFSQSGADINSMQGGMKTLTNQMQAAMKGGAEATATFEALGISFQNADGSMRSSEEVLMEALTALQGISNETEKAALATDLFGRSGTELMPLLNGEVGSITALSEEAHNLGIILNDDVIDSGVALGDSLDATKQALSALTTDIGSSFAPIIMEVSSYIQEHLPEIRTLVEGFANVAGQMFQMLVPILTSLLSNLLPVLISLMNTIMPIVLQLVQAVLPIINNLLSALFPILQPIFNLLGPLINLLMPILTLVSALLDPLLKLLNLIIPPLTTVIAAIADKISSVLGPAFEKISEKVANFMEKIQNLKEKVGKVFENIRDTITKVIDKVKGKFDDVRDKIKSVIDKIKGFFGGFSFSWPTLKMPHFGINPEGWKIGDLLKGVIPKLAINWYDKGGVFTSPTVIGVGERRPEFVGALEDLREIVREESGDTTITLNVYGAAGQDINRLADIVMDRLETATQRKKAALGV